MGSLLDFSKKVRLAKALAGLTDQITKHSAVYESVKAERSQYTPEQLSGLVGPPGKQVTLESTIAAREKDARDVVVGARSNLETLKATIDADTVVFPENEGTEVAIKINEATASIANLKMPSKSPVIEAPVIVKPE